VIQLAKQAADHAARLIDRHVLQVEAAVQALEQHGPAARVGCQEPNGAPSSPVLQCQVLVLGVSMWPRDFHNAGGVVAESDRQHQGAHPVHRVAVEGQIPLRERRLDEPGQLQQPCVTADVRLRRAAGHHGRERFRDADVHVSLSPGNAVSGTRQVTAWTHTSVSS
jgi:hypothetical protein